VKTQSDVSVPELNEASLPCLEDVILEDTEFMALDIPERRAILHPWLKEQQIGLITGARGVGKSGFALGVVNAITRGDPFGPWKPEAHVNCLYVDAEMVCQDVIGRLTSQGAIHRKAKFFIYSDAYAYSKGLRKANALDQEWRESMKDICLKLEVKVLVLDNIASLTPGIDENSKEEWDVVNQWLLRLRFAGVSVLLLHHENKNGGQRGTSAREDNLDISISLKRPLKYRPTDGARFIVNFTKTRIPTKELPLIVDTEFQLVDKPGDVMEWKWKHKRKQNKSEIMKLLDEGMAAKDIADSMGISSSRISQVKAEAIKERLLTKDRKLTQAGLLFTGG
jgi:putative DNA primase/helicase